MGNSADAKPDVLERITEYLSNGGLFNPENMNHDAVRDLLIDAQFARAIEQATAKRCAEICDKQSGAVGAQLACVSAILAEYGLTKEKVK